MTLRSLGRATEAQAQWRAALAIFERLQTSDAEGIRALIGEGSTADSL